MLCCSIVSSAGVSGYGLFEVFQEPRKEMCSGLECSAGFGVGSSKVIFTTLSGGGGDFCCGRASARLYADAREMDIPRAKHRMRGKLVFPRARGARKTRAI